MTNQEINKAIAESIGWTNITLTPHDMGELPPRFIGSPKKDGVRKFLPDYCNDLNAIQEVVKAIPEHLKETYIDWLYDLSVNLCSSQKESEFDLSNASAKTRCEAYLKALGKWEVE